ncbi:MAG TPA: nuclear transport factor 2 family protein [Candidatus Limnocylindrales bacterium]|nr:nuclear transport factor 2 family protein [Candidatus Limnocylindrales bacterium]
MPDLTHGDAQDLLAAYKRAWERRDPELAVSLFSDDAEYREDPFAEPLTGANAIRARWNETAASQANVEFDAERTWVSGRTVLSSWHGAYTRRADAQRVRLRGFMTLELDDAGKVRRFRQWWHGREVGRDATLKTTAGEG